MANAMLKQTELDEEMLLAPEGTLENVETPEREKESEPKRGTVQTTDEVLYDMIEVNN